MCVGSSRPSSLSLIERDGCRQVARLEDAAFVAQQALEDERRKRKAATRDVDELRKAHRAFESDLAKCELRAAEQQLLFEAKNERVRQCEDEIRHLVRWMLSTPFPSKSGPSSVDSVH